jgi:integrase/recombinase XerC
MEKIPSSLHPTVRAWLLDGPLAAHVPPYVARLTQAGYASSTTARCLAAVGHFARWMALIRLTPNRIDESRIDQFLRDHLPYCGCVVRAVSNPREAHAALMPLLAILRREGIIADLPAPAGPIVNELRRYDAHMRDTRGLTERTRRGRLRIVERFLAYKFGGKPLAFDTLMVSDIRRFVGEQMELLNTTSNAITINGALRAYLRWRAMCGDAVRPLLAAIASPANWSLASLPRALQPNEVERVLHSFTDTLRAPKRGYAIVRLALDLGLRGIEINRLQLRDIDWQSGTITLRRTKSRRQYVLPLPMTTGKALEAYLRDERPVTKNPSLMVRGIAPHDQPIGIDGIRGVIRHAFRRAGIAHGRTHALRHTLACRLVEQGSSIKEVADVLRHCSLNTSLIYAKLDRGALAQVALPWPGSAS